jgi:hypothetical protein
MADSYASLRRWLRTRVGGGILDHAVHGGLTDRAAAELLEDFDIGPTPANRLWLAREVDLALREGF